MAKHRAQGSWRNPKQLRVFSNLSATGYIAYLVDHKKRVHAQAWIPWKRTA